MSRPTHPPPFQFQMRMHRISKCMHANAYHIGALVILLLTYLMVYKLNPLLQFYTAKRWYHVWPNVCLILKEWDWDRVWDQSAQPTCLQAILCHEVIHFDAALPFGGEGMTMEVTVQLTIHLFFAEWLQWKAWQPAIHICNSLGDTIHIM